ncbi:hypothetical protein Mapa_012487 [Marchantia paleacea]|nr:hypothetical protein Mapa_012487 [Marchantia paleacea]
MIGTATSLMVHPSQIACKIGAIYVMTHCGTGSEKPGCDRTVRWFVIQSFWMRSPNINRTVRSVVHFHIFNIYAYFVMSKN